MSYQNSKRFTYGISRNTTSHKAGANQVTIATNSDDGFYSSGGVQLAMSVKEARALQSFLNTELTPVVSDSDVDSQIS
jgi:hypothetical protein